MIIGLVGGICSGKSTVATIFSLQGAIIIDADKLGHEVYIPGTEAFGRIIDCFGQQILGIDGFINRAELGKIVFSNPLDMKKLTDIVWPEIRKLIIIEIDAIRNEHGQFKLVVIEAAVMLEAGWQDLVDRLVVVSVEREVAIQRLMSRNNLERTEAEKRVNSQMSNTERESFAHFIIKNESSLDELESRVHDIWNEIITSSVL